jgi:hypothetical protein
MHAGRMPDGISYIPCIFITMSYLKFIFPFLILFTTTYADAQCTSYVTVKPGNHYFTDCSGKPFLWIGDTQWELMHLLSVKDAKQLLLERKKQGFTVVQCMTTGVYREWGQSKGLSVDNSNEAWQHNDPLRPNEEYFRRMDSIVNYAAEINMVIVAGIYHAQDVEHGRISRTNARQWARWLSSRYHQATHLIWSMYPHADTSSMDILREVVSGIRQGDGGNHLITVHPDPSPRSSSYFFPAVWISFNTLQTWNSGVINYSMVQSDYNRTGALPVVNGEARYEEEDGTTSFDTRRAAYFSMLAGGYYSYGHRDNWKAPRDWRSWFRSAGAMQMQLLSELFKELDWWNLVPDPNTLVRAMPGNIAAHSKKNDWLIAYLSRPQLITVNRQFLPLVEHCKAFWINPETGKKTRAAFRKTQSGILFTPPSWKDALLLVRAYDN